MWRSIVGAIGLFFVGTATAQNLFHVTPEKTLQDVPVVIGPEDARVVIPDYTTDTAIKIRIEKCVERGASSKNCQCRAETSARILEKKDFDEETWYLEIETETGLRFFHNRMLKEQPDRMLRLGNALKNCPASMMRLE